MGKYGRPDPIEEALSDPAVQEAAEWLEHHPPGAALPADLENRIGADDKFTWFQGDVSWWRDEHEACERGTVGCSVAHGQDDSDCQTW